MRTRTASRPRLALALVALTPALLAACGSSSTRSASTHAAPPRTVTRTVTRPATQPAATSASSATSTSTASSTASATSHTADDQCVADQLSLTFLGGLAANGHSKLGFALRNTSSGSCRTGGYPGVLFIGAHGAGLPTSPDHTTSDFFGQTTLSELTVAPGAEVSFRLGVTDGATGAGCLTADRLQVIPPDDTRTLSVMLGAGISECRGRVTVSPLQAGTSAFH